MRSRTRDNRLPAPRRRGRRVVGRETRGDIRVWGMIAPRPRSPFPATVCYILGTNSVVKTSDAGGDFKARQEDSSSKAQDKLTAHSVGEEPQSESHFGLGNKVWLEPVPLLPQPMDKTFAPHRERRVASAPLLETVRGTRVSVGRTARRAVSAQGRRSRPDGRQPYWFPRERCSPPLRPAILGRRLSALSESLARREPRHSRSGPVQAVVETGALNARPAALPLEP